MPDDSKVPEISPRDLDKQVLANPKSKGWNNPNSRKNLRQYRKPEDEFIIPEVVDPYTDDGSTQAAEIVRGRKLSVNMVKKLIPERGVFTADEKRRFTGIVV